MANKINLSHRHAEQDLIVWRFQTLGLILFLVGAGLGLLFPSVYLMAQVPSPPSAAGGVDDKAAQKWEVFVGPSYLGQSRGDSTIQNNGGIHSTVDWNLSSRWSVVFDYSSHWGHPSRTLLETITIISGTDPIPGTEGRPDTKVGGGKGTCNPSAADPAIPGCEGSQGIPGTPPITVVERDTRFTGFNSIHRFMGGMRYRRHAFYRSDWPKVTVFAHLLAGPSITKLRGSSQSGMALAAGGGIDYEITDRFSARILQVDYAPVWFNGQRFDAVRASGGLVVKW